jgi:hypothetical protein
MTDDNTDDTSTTPSQEEVDDLLARLDKLAEDLTDGQKALLAGILKVAADVEDVGVEPRGSFDEQFAASFTANKAGVVLRYAHTAGLVNPPYDGIHCNTAANTHAAIHRT